MGAVITPSRPLGAGSPDPLDLDAADQLERNEDGRLGLVRARAEKWIGGISALGGLLGTVLVVKGRDTVTQITLGWRAAAAVNLAAALILLAYGTYRAYQAAFGDPSALAQINPIPLAGLHARLLQARRTAAETALKHLAAAINAVFAGIALIAIGVAITWFAPAAPTATHKAICVYSKGELVVRLDGDSALIKQTAAGTTLSPCP